jgi:hypothetical protein
MVKLETFRRKRHNPDFQKCALVAALLSAFIVVGVQLTGGPVAPANAGLGTPAAAPASAAPVSMMPASAPH